MKEYLRFATALMVAPIMAQADGLSESATTLGYKAGYEWQSGDTQLLNLSLTGLASDHFAIEALALHDRLGDQTSAGLGIRYSQPIFSERFAISAATRHFWTRDNDISPKAQVLLGAAYQLPINTRHALEFGAGGYYSILDRDSLNPVKHDNAGAYLSVSWRYNPGARQKAVVSEPPVAEPVADQSVDIAAPPVAPEVEQDYSIGTVHFAFDSTDVVSTQISASPEQAQYDVDFVAYFSCSGPESYNRRLSLRRIQKAKDLMLAKGFKFNREGYTVASQCSTVAEIRVEISKKAAEEM